MQDGEATEEGVVAALEPPEALNVPSDLLLGLPEGPCLKVQPQDGAVDQLGHRLDLGVPALVEGGVHPPCRGEVPQLAICHTEVTCRGNRVLLQTCVEGEFEALPHEELRLGGTGEMLMNVPRSPGRVG